LGQRIQNHPFQMKKSIKKKKLQIQDPKYFNNSVKPCKLSLFKLLCWVHPLNEFVVLFSSDKSLVILLIVENKYQEENYV